MRSSIDHLVVVAPSLDLGVRWVEQVLGVPMGPGGEHVRMGTHNCLLRLQAETYLEVIAPDPSAPSPSMPRWFGLDDLAPNQAPFLGAWVVRTDDIHTARSAIDLNIGADIGVVHPMTRGPWSWQITIPTDGRQPLGGLAPALIEWPAGEHPTTRMPESGVRLRGLTLHHGDTERAQGLIDALGLQQEVAVQRALPGAESFLDAVLDTPSGPCRLFGVRMHRP